MTRQTDRRRPITAAQWLAARAISEGAPPTRRRVAAVMGCDDSAVYARAGEEGWKRLDFRRRDVRDAYRDLIAIAAVEDDDDPGGSGLPGDDEGDEAWFNVCPPTPEAPEDAVPDVKPGDDPVATLARCAAFVARRVDAVISRAEGGRRISKTEIDALLTMTRMMERLETFAAERTKEKEEPGDEELAAILGRINDRIIELAEGLAGQLVEARADARPAETAS